MKSSRGFTLIEAMIVFAIFGIITAILLPAISGKTPGGNNYDPTECVGGFVFHKQSNKQVIGENGGGVKCKDSASGPGSSKY